MNSFPLSATTGKLAGLTALVAIPTAFWTLTATPVLLIASADEKGLVVTLDCESTVASDWWLPNSSLVRHVSSNTTARILIPPTAAHGEAYVEIGETKLFDPTEVLPARIQGPAERISVIHSPTGLSLTAPIPTDATLALAGKVHRHWQVGLLTVLALHPEGVQLAQTVLTEVQRIAGHVAWPVRIFTADSTVIPPNAIARAAAASTFPLVLGPFPDDSMMLRWRVATIVAYAHPALVELAPRQRLALASWLGDRIQQSATHRSVYDTPMFRDRYHTCLSTSERKADWLAVALDAMRLHVTQSSSPISLSNIGQAIAEAASLIIPDSVSSESDAAPCWRPPESAITVGRATDTKSPSTASSNEIEIASKYIGFLEDCGCKSSSAGGLARLLARWYGQPKNLHIILGNMLGVPGRPDYVPNYDDIIVNMLSQAQRAIPLVYVPSSTEILAICEQRTKATSPRFVAANLPDDSRWNAVAHWDATVADRKYRIIGVVTPSTQLLSPRQCEIVDRVLLDPVVSVLRAIAEIPADTVPIVAGTLTMTAVEIIEKSVGGRPILFILERCGDKVRNPHGDWINPFSCISGNGKIVFNEASIYGVTQIQPGTARLQPLLVELFTDPALPSSVTQCLTQSIEDASIAIGVPSFQEPLSTRGRYVGSASCASCHHSEWEDWKASPHADAFQTLRRVQRHRVAGCVRCHVVGYGLPGGYTVAREELEAVGCESCHGPGLEHTREPRGANILRSPDEARCTQCHDADHSDYNQSNRSLYYARVDHK